MKIEIIQNENITETEITIKAKVLDEELSEIIACLSLIGNTVAGARDGTVVPNLLVVLICISLMTGSQ